MERKRAEQLGLKPRARFHAFALGTCDPVIMLTAPIPATHAVLKRAGMSLNQIDAVEINEAFAPVVLAWAKEFGADMSKVNPNGGAIALGHPLGASGARLMTTLLNYLERTKALWVADDVRGQRHGKRHDHRAVELGEREGSRP
jgi:acetyl-CoA acyltransferase